MAPGPTAIKQTAEKNYSAKWDFLHGKVNFQNSTAIIFFSENESKNKPPHSQISNLT
jgi:hypothetical protein